MPDRWLLNGIIAIWRDFWLVFDAILGIYCIFLQAFGSVRLVSAVYGRVQMGKFLPTSICPLMEFATLLSAPRQRAETHLCGKVFVRMRIIAGCASSLRLAPKYSGIANASA